MDIFYLSKKWALILSLPTIIPLILVFADLFDTKDEIRTVVTGKRWTYRSVQVKFHDVWKNVPTDDYNAFHICDSVAYMRGHFLKGADWVHIKGKARPIFIHETLAEFFYGILVAMPFIIFLH